MKRSTGVSIVLSLLAVWVLHPLEARCFEERVYVFRSLDDPAVPYDPAVLQRAPWWNPAWDPYNPPAFVIPLGASLWTFTTKDGRVVEDTKKRIGTGTAVGLINDPSFTPFGSLAPFYFEFSLDGKGRKCRVNMAADGYAMVTSRNMPEAGIVLLGCNLAILPDPGQGILGGSAVSNSLFNPAGLSGYQTGSLWTVRAEVE